MIKNKTHLKSFPESSRWSDISGAKFLLHVTQKSDGLCFLTVAQRVTFLNLLRQRLKHVLNPKILPKIIIRANKTQHYPSRSLLLRRFVFRMAERVSAKRVTGDEPQGTMGRLGRQAKRRLPRCLLPAFLCAHILIKRETSGYEADPSR